MPSEIYQKVVGLDLRTAVNNFIFPNEIFVKSKQQQHQNPIGLHRKEEAVNLSDILKMS